MKPEPTQPGNPHRLTINQHVFPKASIQRFGNQEGFVEVFLKRQSRVLRLKPSNPIFCAHRAWDQRTETGVGKYIEDKFQRLASAIEKGSVTTIGIFEKRIVEEFFSLWRTRQKFRLEGLEDVQLNGLTGDLLTKDEQEILESNHYVYSTDGTMKGRSLAGLHVFGYQHRFIHNNRDMRWGIAQSSSADFIIPDCFEDMMIVPISPRIAIVADQPDSMLTPNQVAAINQVAITKASNYYFARRLSATSIVRDAHPPFERLLNYTLSRPL